VSLTSPEFRALTIAAALLATTATMLLWNRVGGSRAVRVTSRLGLLVASYILTAVAVLVSINIAYGGLIASWGDLLNNLGAGPLHAIDKVSVVPPRSNPIHLHPYPASRHPATSLAATTHQRLAAAALGPGHQDERPKLPGRESTAPLSRPGHDRSQFLSEPRGTARPR
jgi:hypothetical protein